MELLNGYIYIPVSDFKKAAEWYKNILGFVTVFTDPLYYELRTPSGIRVMLIERRDGVNSHMMYDTGAQPAYGFSVPNAEAAYNELISKNVEVGKISLYQGKSFGFYDTDGNKIEIWEEKK